MSGNKIISGTLDHDTPTRATELAQKTVIPRMQRLRDEHLTDTTNLVTYFDAARVRLRLNPDDLSAGMAMEAATCDRFEDFMDRVNKLAGQ